MCGGGGRGEGADMKLFARFSETVCEVDSGTLGKLQTSAIVWFTRSQSCNFPKVPDLCNSVLKEQMNDKKMS